MQQKTRAVGVRELKNRLSAYLREVRLGARILVLDHNEVVGELCEPTHRSGGARVSNPLVNAWIQQGVVTAPTGIKQDCPQSPLKEKAGTSARLLREERGDP